MAFIPSGSYILVKSRGLTFPYLVDDSVLASLKMWSTLTVYDFLMIRDFYWGADATWVIALASTGEEVGFFNYYLPCA